MCRAGGKQIWINFSYFLLSWDRKLRIYSRKSCLQEVKKFLPKVTAHCWLFVHTYCISLFIHRLQKAIRQPRHCVSSSSSNYDWLVVIRLIFLIEWLTWRLLSPLDIGCLQKTEFFWLKWRFPYFLTCLLLARYHRLQLRRTLLSTQTFSYISRFLRINGR